MINAVGLQGHKKESAALSRVMKIEEKLPGTGKIKDSNLVMAEFVSVLASSFEIMGLEGLKCYK